MHETHRFFTPTTRVNWAENILLGHPMARRKDRVAIYACNEANPAIQSRSARIADMLIRTLTWDELYLEVARAHGGLIELGVKEGDRVAAITSNNAGKQYSSLSPRHA